MKALPYKIVDHPETNKAYERCSVSEATHVQLHMYGPFPDRIIPVITKGTRDGHIRGIVWTWNGDVEKPDIKPSILKRGCKGDYDPTLVVCHTWINDGMVIFLDDCTHEFAGKTLPLLNVEE